jgi:hypothetical protein
MSIFLGRRERRDVGHLSRRIALCRGELQRCNSDFHARVDAPLRSPWALPCCFAAGFAAGKLGLKVGRVLRVLPLYNLSLLLARSLMGNPVANHGDTP